ncbi:S-adenosyl-L-methionine-dependent methyltransferase [Geopyxis carbonaria]|nr:S-adenosyl-L-methionine-dependent methyltransferase [Geopyxis carbonaria]
MSHCHTHNSGHVHHHASTTEIQDANKAYFAKGAAVHTHANKAQFARISSYVTSAIVSIGLPLDDEVTRVLDYACGSGAISQALAPHVKQIVGMDLSSDMVDMYNTAVSNQGIPANEMHAVVADLCTQEDDEKLKGEDYQNFDVAVCSLALHHIADPRIAVQKMVERLKRGSGYLVVVDFRKHQSVAEMPGGEKLQHVIPHNGFVEEDIKKWYEQAGLVDIEFTDVGPKGKGGRGMSIGATNPETGEAHKFSREIFLVSGRRA